MHSHTPASETTAHAAMTVVDSAGAMASVLDVARGLMMRRSGELRDHVHGQADAEAVRTDLRTGRREDLGPADPAGPGLRRRPGGRNRRHSPASRHGASPSPGRPAPSPARSPACSAAGSRNFSPATPASRYTTGHRCAPWRWHDACAIRSPAARPGNREDHARTRLRANRLPRPPIGFIEPTAAGRISYAGSLAFESVHEAACREHGFEITSIQAAPATSRVAVIAALITPPS
jgi:hypothetical protein